MHTAAEAVLGTCNQNQALFSSGSYHHHIWASGEGTQCPQPINRCLEKPTFTLNMRMLGIGEEEGEAGKCGCDTKNAYEMG